MQGYSSRKKIKTLFSHCFPKEITHCYCVLERIPGEAATTASLLLLLLPVLLHGDFSVMIRVSHGGFPTDYCTIKLGRFLSSSKVRAFLTLTFFQLGDQCISSLPQRLQKVSKEEESPII